MCCSFEIKEKGAIRNEGLNGVASFFRLELVDVLPFFFIFASVTRRNGQS